MNELFVISEIIMIFLLLYMVNLLFGKKGIMLFIIISVLIFMLLSNSFIDFLNFPLNEGCVIYSSCLFSLNLLNQKYGRDYLEKFSYIVLIVLIIGYAIMALVRGVGISSNLVSNIYFDNTFIISFRDCISIMLTFYITANASNYLYYKIRIKKNKIWISNIITSIICGFVDSLIYSILAYAGNMNIVNLIKVILINSIVKIFVGIIFTFYIYRECKI